MNSKNKTITLSLIICFNVFINEVKAESNIADLSEMSLEELLNIEVEVASLSKESDLTVGSTVALVNEDNWVKRGARRTNEAIGYLPSTVLYSLDGGGHAIAIRGYSSNLSSRGVATAIDGVPMNTFSSGSASYYIPNFDLVNLNRIEMIRGPGSALYGSDAFHGVYSLRTYESEQDNFSANLEGSINSFYKGGVRVTKNFNFLKIDSSFGFSGQGNQNLNLNNANALHQDNFNNQSMVLKASSDSNSPLSFKSGIYLNHWNANNFPGLNKIGEVELKDKNLSGSETGFFMANSSIMYQLPYEINAEINGFYWKNYNNLQNNTIFNSNNALSKTNIDEYRTGFNVIARQSGNNRMKTQWLLSYGFNQMGIPSAITEFESIDDENKSLQRNKLSYQGLSRNIHSFFSQAKTSIFRKKFHLLYGARLDVYSDFGVQFTPRGGLIYQPTEKSALKLLYGNAFRAGVADELTSSNQILGNKDLKPENIRTTELIYMQTSDFWKTNLTLFRSEWQNAIIKEELKGNPDFYYRYTNNGRNESLGGELDFQLFWNNFNFDFGSSYIYSRNINTNLKFDSFPAYIANLGVGYNIKEWNIECFLNNRFMFDISEFPSSINNKASNLSPYFRSDLNISWQTLPNLKTTFNIRNIFNISNKIPSLFGVSGGVSEIGISPSIRMEWSI